MWLRRLWPILTAIVLAFEGWALVDGVPGNTITEWVSDFPRTLWGLVIAGLVWLVAHLVRWRRLRQEKRLPPA